MTLEAEVRTHEAKTHLAEAEARTHEAEAKFMRRQSFENRKNCNGSLVKTRRHVQNVRN